ncbi:MAG: hypothetical protein R3D81_11000 [Thalassovita sp.]
MATNRFAQSAREKVDLSFRHRARAQIANALVIFMPIAAPFDQLRIEVLCDQDPILLNGTEIAGRVDDATIPKTASGSSSFISTRWLCRGRFSMPAGGQDQCP